MKFLVLASAAFVLTHLVSGTPLRATLVAALGEWPYRGLYSAAAFVTLAAMIWAYTVAPRAAHRHAVRARPHRHRLSAQPDHGRRRAAAPERGPGARHDPHHAPSHHVGHHALGTRAHRGARRCQITGVLRRFPRGSRVRHAVARSAQARRSEL